MQRNYSKRSIFLILTAIFLSGIMYCSRDSLIKHSVLEEEIVDDHLKAQVTLKVLIPEKAKIEDCRNLLLELYKNTKSRTGFKKHKSPTGIFIYLYTSEESSNSSSAWIGMLGWEFPNHEPNIHIQDTIQAGIGLDSETRFGLSLKRRKKIYRRINKTKEDVRVEAETKFPLNIVLVLILVGPS